MTSQPWILVYLNLLRVKYYALQWSHDLSAMDTGGGDGLAGTHERLASMEP